jgi:hypothetical protein
MGQFDQFQVCAFFSGIGPIKWLEGLLSTAIGKPLRQGKIYLLERRILGARLRATCLNNCHASM